jgi:hypothetical protein
VAEWVHFELINKDPDLRGHTHDLEVFDKYKRSEALQVLAKNKCEEGNSFSATAKWMNKTYGEISKQVSKFEKGDTANAAQMWRKGTRDYVLREVVPEDSEEMTTMRKCVDAIVEADAPSLRAALREVLKDSDELTKAALAILEKHKPAVTTPEPEEPWKLTEGVSVMNLPPPGAPRKLKNNPGVHQEPKRTPDPPPPSDPNSNRQEGPQLGPPTMLYPPFMGPDGRPIPSPAVPAPATKTPLKASAPAAQPQQNMHPQPPGPATANMQQARGTALQPRPPMPTYSGPSPVEVRYVYPPLQQGAIHPITVSMEVPSCHLGNCRQCNHMRRDLAGRTFFFQDTLITPAHFTALQELLRDPKLLLHDSYTNQLLPSQVPLWHRHPALGTAPAPPRPGAYNPQAVHRAVPAPGPHGNQQLQWVALPGHGLPPPPPSPPAKPRAKAPRKSTKAKTADGAGEPASIYDKALPVPLSAPIVIEDDDDDDDDDAVGGVEADAVNKANVSETDGGANDDKVEPEKGSGDDNAAVDKDGDEDASDGIAEGINAEMNADDSIAEGVNAAMNENATQEVEIAKNNTGGDNNENEEDDDDDDDEVDEVDEDDEIDDEEEQRPAKRRRQESVAED